MIDFKEAYPTPQQFESFDPLKEVNEEFELHKKNFNYFRQTTIDENALIENEIIKAEASRDNINSPQSISFAYRTDNPIDLFPLFKEGWESALSGTFVVVNNCYKFHPEIKNAIEKNYNTTMPPMGYFERLARVAMDEVIRGMAHAKYYYWLKKLQTESISCMSMKETQSSNSSDTIKPDIATFINLLANQEYKIGEKLIPVDVKEYIICLLLTGSNTYLKPTPWIKAYWKLWVLLKVFVDESYLNIKENQIPEYMMEHFTFKGKTTRKSILDSLNQAQNKGDNKRPYNLFTVELYNICGKLKGNN